MSERDPQSLEVRFLRGAGPRRAALLEKLGIRTVGDLLLHPPSRYVDRTVLTPLASLKDHSEATVMARVVGVELRRWRGGRSEVTALLEDMSGSGRAVWFNQPYLARSIRPGARILVSGQVRDHRGLRISNPEFEILAEESEAETGTGVGDGTVAGGIIPLYPLTAGISQKVVRTLVREALAQISGAGVADPLPEALLRRRNLAGRADAIRAVHLPESLEQAEEARRRLAFEEFLIHQILLLRLRTSLRKPGGGRALRGDPRMIERLRASLPFQLTAAQERAWEAIRSDLSGDAPAMRLLQGDVGSGKTIVAALACAATISAGAQGCVMAPTELLASQHASSMARILGPAGIRSALLVGRTQAAERRRILAALAAGECDLLIGTHALLEPDVLFRDLGLVVVDEQHRFGVEQRLRLREKGPRPHMLVLSATPIPRTLALVIYGDLDLATIDELPPGRTPVRTRLVERARWNDLLAFVAGRMRRGQQAFFIYPLVEESDKISLRDATRMHAEITAHSTMRGLSIGLMHGRSDSGERDRLMAAMREGRLHGLVATTVVEVGIDLPLATVMVVEHPERFGLSQLHQLRGRIGRAPGETPYFFLTIGGGESGDMARERLRILVHESDGFRIAEEDLRLRGPGDLLGRQQAGPPQLRMGDLAGDTRVLGDARAEAEGLLRSDPSMEAPENARLWAEVLRRYPEASRLFGAA